MTSNRRYGHLDNPETIINDLLSSEPKHPGFSLTVEDFRTVYEAVQKKLPGTPVDIVLNGDWAMAQFSKISNQRLRIIPNLPQSRLSKIYNSRLLSEKDFEFALLHSELHGIRTPPTIRALAVEEISSHPFILSTILVVSSLVLWIVAANGALESLSSVNELLITATTLYLSIFLLFTASQNIEIVKDIQFFKAGLTYRFFAVDRFIATLALMALLIGFVNIMLVTITPNQPASLLQVTFSTPDLSLIVVLSTGLAITLLADSFLALIQYYFSRVRYLVEQELTGQLLDTMMEQKNSDQKLTEDKAV